MVQASQRPRPKRLSWESPRDGRQRIGSTSSPVDGAAVCLLETDVC